MTFFVPKISFFYKIKKQILKRNSFSSICLTFASIYFWNCFLGVIVIVINHKCTGSKKWPFKCVWSSLMNYPHLSIKQNEISLASSFLKPTDYHSNQYLVRYKILCFLKPILFTVFLNKDLWHPNCIESHTNNFLKYFFCMFVFVHYLPQFPWTILKIYGKFLKNSFFLWTIMMLF